MVGVASKKSTPPRSFLEEISIRGLGVIDNATVEFKPGLNVITGETGAGKTMLLTALSLVTGGKADSDLVRSNQERVSTSAQFGYTKKLPSEISTLIEEHDLPNEDNGTLLSRSVTRDGKSKAMVNGHATTATVLSNFASELIEVHGQHANLVLSKPAKQREILDIFCGGEFEAKLITYQHELTKYQGLKAEFNQLKKELGDRERLIAELKQVDIEYRKIKPNDGELAELDNLISKLESIEDLRIAATGASESLNSEDQGALGSLHQGKRLLSQAKGKDQFLDALNDRFSDALFSLIDIGSDLERYVEALSADPNALENALQRRSLIVAFAKKYGNSSDRQEALIEAIELAKDAKNRLDNLEGGEERVAQLAQEAKAQRDKVKERAQALSELRSQNAIKFATLVETELKSLAMPRAKLAFRLTTRTGESDSDFLSHGLDDVQIEFSAHDAGNLLPIAKAASGGELSRLMLGIEVVIAGSYPVGTYVFDEVDAGVGGKAALDVGRRLMKLSQNAQVIVVTHLPQVAMWADHHIVVQKNSAGAVTESTIRSLQESEREIEIARMLSGLEDSEHAQEHARELLNLRLTEKA